MRPRPARPSWAAAARPKSAPRGRRHDTACGQMNRQTARGHRDGKHDGRRVAGERPQVELGAEEHERKPGRRTLGYARELHLEAGRFAEPGEDEPRPEAREEVEPPERVAMSERTTRIRSVTAAEGPSLVSASGPAGSWPAASGSPAGRTNSAPTVQATISASPPSAAGTFSVPIRVRGIRRTVIASARGIQTSRQPNSGPDQATLFEDREGNGGRASGEKDREEERRAPGSMATLGQPDRQRQEGHHDGAMTPPRTPARRPASQDPRGNRQPS